MDPIPPALTARERIPTVICRDHGELAQRVAERIANVIRERRAAGHRPVLGLATGATPIGVYRERGPGPATASTLSGRAWSKDRKAVASAHPLRDKRVLMSVGRLTAGIAVALLVPMSPALAQGGELVRATVHSPALAGNLVGDSPYRSVFVYLPPSYRGATERRYPTVTLLHGVGDSNADWINGQYQGLNLAVVLDSLIAAGAMQEMIVVMPDARNAYDGSFYTNSPVTGNWEDFVVRDLVTWMDSTYRTLPEPASRGLAGHSMGGYGALKIAFTHPELFGSVYALSACCIDWLADFSAANAFWPRTLSLRLIDHQAETEFYPKLFTSIAAAWSPDTARPPFRAALPFRLTDSTLQPAEPAFSQWTANLILPIARRRTSSVRRLRALGFDYGDRDQFPHIPLGAQALSRFLTVHDIPHRAEAYDGDHFNRVRERLVRHALPFLSAALVAR